MDFQTSRTNLLTERPFSLKAVLTNVEAETALPGNLRDETRVFHADARCPLTEGHLDNGHLTAEGTVIFNVLFAQGDLAKVIPIETTVEFSQPLHLPQEISQDSDVSFLLNAQVQKVQAKAFNGRLIMKAQLLIQGMMIKNRIVSVIKDISGPCTIEKNMENISFERKTGSGLVCTVIRDEVELSDILQIQDTLSAAARAVTEDIQITEKGKVHLIGTIYLDVCHASKMPDRPLISTRHKIPFEQEIFLSGTSGDIIKASSAAEDVIVVSQDDNEESSGKIMRCEVTVRSTVQSFQTENFSYLTDAYTSEGENIQVTEKENWIHTASVHENLTENSRLSFVLPDQTPPVHQPLLAFLQPCQIHSKQAGGKLQIDGMMNITLIYTADDSKIPVSYTAEEPFTVLFPSELLPDDQITLTAEETVPAAIAGNRIEIKYLLCLSGQGERFEKVSAAVDAVSAADEGTAKGVTLYFPESDETIWDIGRKYRVPVEKIKALNPDAKDTNLLKKPVLIYNTAHSAT